MNSELSNMEKSPSYQNFSKYKPKDMDTNSRKAGFKPLVIMINLMVKKFVINIVIIVPLGNDLYSLSLVFHD